MRRTMRWAAASCAAVLLAQAAAVPLLHAWHASGRAVGGSPSASTAGPRGGGAAVLELYGGGPAGAERHDAASCPICATLAHGRVWLVPVVLAGAVPRAAHGVLVSAVAGMGSRPCVSRGGPRAPPAFFS